MPLRPRGQIGVVHAAARGEARGSGRVIAPAREAKATLGEAERLRCEFGVGGQLALGRKNIGG